MIKKLFVFVYIFSFNSLFSQQTTPTVELPDFVITGTDVVSVDRAQKMPPEFVSTISEQFIKPVFSPEELEIKDLSSPLKKDLNILDSLNFLRGYFDFHAGIYSLPAANLAYLLPVDDVIFEARFNGEHQRGYIENSERYFINGGLNITYTVNNKSEVLPGTQIKFLGDFGSSSYKFFAINDPLKRTLNRGNFSFGISNQSNRLFIFDFNIADDFSSINEEKFTENILSLNGFSRLSFSPINLGVSAGYKKQFLGIESTPAGTPNADVDDFFSVRPSAGLDISNIIKISGGVTYSSSGERSYTAPYASLGIKLSKNISLFGEYSPHAEFVTSGKLLAMNRYFDPQNFYNLFVRKRNAVTAAVKFEYDKYYQVNAGVRYFTSPEYPYLRDSTGTGKFMLVSSDAEGLTFFTDLLFHHGPFGMFYGTVELSEIKNNSGKIIPYHPRFNASVAYGYNFDIGLNTEVKLFYASESYSVIENTTSLPGYFNLGLDFSYKVVSNFFLTLKFANLLNENIYIWNGYKEPPLDVMGGFIYRW